MTTYHELHSVSGPFRSVSRYPIDFSCPETQVRMLRNTPKYRVFSKALAAVVQDRTVLDIGTGSGILALLSHAHGAKRVVAVDREPVIEMTSEVLKGYRLGNAVEVVKGDVFDLDWGENKFDVIVSETIGYLGFEENIAVILSYATQRWGDARTVCLPSDIGVWAEPVWVSGVPAPSMPFLTAERETALGCERVDALCPAVLRTCENTHDTGLGVWRASTGLIVNAVAVYFDAGLCGTARITNKNNSNWPHCVVPLRQPISLRKGESIGCRLRLTPSVEGCYLVVLRVQDKSGQAMQEATFESSEIQSDRIPAAPNTVGDVIGEVENVLRDLGLFSDLSRSHGVTG